MKKINTSFLSKEAHIEEAHIIKLEGYTSQKEAERAIFDLFDDEDKEGLTIEYSWIGSDLSRCIVDMAYITKKGRS